MPGNDTLQYPALALGHVVIYTGLSDNVQVVLQQNSAILFIGRFIAVKAWLSPVCCIFRSC